MNTVEPNEEQTKEKAISPSPKTQDSLTGPTCTSKSWSQMVGENMRKSATEKSIHKRKTTKIKPEFESETTG